MIHSTAMAILATAATLPLLCLVGCNSSVESMRQAGKRDPVPVKSVMAVETKVSRSSQQPATVHAFFETEIRARVSGYVIEISADIGDVVQAGDRLCRVDVPELEKQREALSAQIDLLTAEERHARAGIELSDAALRSARARSDQAKSEQARVDASLAAAEAEYRRTQDLVNRGSLQNRVLDEVRKKRDTETAAKAAVLAAVSSAEAEVGVAEAERSAAEARLTIAESKTQVARRELEKLDVSLDFANVVAPFSGMVTQRHVELGDLIEGRVGAGSEALFVLSQVDKLRVRIPVPEIDAPFVQPGAALTLSFPSLAFEQAINATVARGAGSLDPGTRTMIVEAEIENSDGKLLPGMFGQATIDLETKVAATVLPSRAVRFDEEGNAFVYVIDSSNQVRIAEVSAGMDTGTEIEILSGVRPGDHVIGPHLQRFSDGQEVRPL